MDFVSTCRSSWLVPMDHHEPTKTTNTTCVTTWKKKLSEDSSAVIDPNNTPTAIYTVRPKLQEITAIVFKHMVNH